MARWQKPYYKLSASDGRQVIIDVTTSISSGLGPHRALKSEIIPFFKNKGVSSVIDFGAGALRHSIPLINSGFQVCGIEFEEAFQRNVASEALKKAQRNANFSQLVWPKQFVNHRKKFDAALLIYVLQTMPLKSERLFVLKQLKKKLKNDGYLVYMSRYGQVTAEVKRRRVKDGYFMRPNNRTQSFYIEFATEETHDLMQKHGFRHIRSLGSGGSEQVFVYSAGTGTWV